MMRGLWYKVPAELFNNDYMTKADVAVFAYVADRIKGETKAVSVRSVAAATELSSRQVQKSLKKLCEWKYLLATERAGQATLYKQTLIPIKSQEGGAEDESKDVHFTRSQRPMEQKAL